jgi:hypothetical protein
LLTYWVTSAVVVPPDVNKDPGSCLPTLSWAPVHGPGTADVPGGGVAAGPVARTVAVAGAVAEGDWLGGVIAVTAGLAGVGVVTDGTTTGPP